MLWTIPTQWRNTSSGCVLFRGLYLLSLPFLVSNKLFWGLIICWLLFTDTLWNFALLYFAQCFKKFDPLLVIFGHLWDLLVYFGAYDKYWVNSIINFHFYILISIDILMEFHELFGTLICYFRLWTGFKSRHRVYLKKIMVYFLLSIYSFMEFQLV